MYGVSNMPLGTTASAQKFRVLDIDEHCKVQAFLQANLLTSDKLCSLLVKKSRGAFDAIHYEQQYSGAIHVAMIDFPFWDKADTMSICDHCKKVTTETPKMMICASCKTRHYCSKECQKLHWKAGHKRVCAAELAAGNQSKTVRLCQKLMALLSVDVRSGAPPVVNAMAGRFKQHLIEFGIRGCIYVPVCDSLELSFIPMPIEVMDILLPVTPDCKFSYGSGIEMAHDNPSAMLLVPSKHPTKHNVGVLENTAVHAFVAQCAPSKGTSRYVHCE